jgi:hypothetical protein
VKPAVKIFLYVLFAACFLGFSYGMYSGLHPKPALPTSSSTNAPAAASADGAVPPPSKELGRVMTFGSLAFAALVGLAILIARDFSHLFASRVEKLVWDDEGEGMKNPEYEEAEQVWANGRHLEAIQRLRDYLDRHPREQYVALRIAEIYEKDLQNHLAAALEYEEILKKKLPAERWGWAAIHLANLYSGRLNKPDEALALLRRIDTEFGHTAAAKKARERLANFETQGTDGLQEAAQPGAALPEDSSGPKLPPGFRPLKS